nr:DinB family protein [Nakamurella sp. PAMC28650]
MTIVYREVDHGAGGVIWVCQAAPVIDDFAKAHLHEHLRWVREALVWKLEGLPEYDIRRPLTMTGTNLLGLIKHNAISDSRYFGEVFDRPFAEPLPRWDDKSTAGSDHWARQDETRADILGLYRRVWDHVDATINALEIDSPGFVPWWNEDVRLFSVMVHRLSDTTRHAGHADILREQLDGSVGVDPSNRPLHGRDSQFWTARTVELERIAAATAQPHTLPNAGQRT